MKVCLTDWPDRTYVGDRAEYDFRRSSLAGAPNASLEAGTRQSEPGISVELLRFVRLDEIVGLLRNYKHVSHVVTQLRSLAYSRVHNLARFDDEKAIQQLASQILCGNWVVWSEKRRRPTMSVAVAVRPPPAVHRREPRALTLRRTQPAMAEAWRPPPPPAPAPAPVETTFGADIDVAAMVDGLRRAAREGVPFCEECARGAAQRQMMQASA